MVVLGFVLGMAAMMALGAVVSAREIARLSSVEESEFVLMRRR
jgi:hypothetical protein